MSCIKCEDLSSPETHIIGDFVRSLHCPYCNKERLAKLVLILGWILLLFIIPIGLYSLIKWDPVISKETDEVGAMTLGVWIVPILWWTILGMYSTYREQVGDLKYELLKMKALSYKLARKEIQNASQKNLLSELKKFLKDVKEQGNMESLDVVEYNIKAIDLMYTAAHSNNFDEDYVQFCKFTN